MGGFAQLFGNSYKFVSRIYSIILSCDDGLNLFMNHHPTTNSAYADTAYRCNVSSSEDLFCTLRNMVRASMYVWDIRKSVPSDFEAGAQSWKSHIYSIAIFQIQR